MRYSANTWGHHNAVLTNELTPVAVNASVRNRGYTRPAYEDLFSMHSDGDADGAAVTIPLMDAQTLKKLVQVIPEYSNSEHVWNRHQAIVAQKEWHRVANCSGVLAAPHYPS